MRELRSAYLGAVSLTIFGVLAHSQSDGPANGTIHGVVTNEDGLPAENVGLTAHPLEVALATVLPHTKTNDAGEYRFEHVPWWGKYTVFADDEDAGYSSYSTDRRKTGYIPSVEISAAHPDARLNLQLPPKAGFLHIHLTSRKTGAAIPGMQVKVMAPDKPEALLFSVSCSSTKAILLPPDTNLLLHVSSTEFEEWSESAGRGMLVRVASGERLTLNIELRPAP